MLFSVCFTWDLWYLQYSQLGQLSVGPISYAEDEDGSLLPLIICKEHYKRGSVEPSDEAYDIDAQLDTGEITDWLFRKSASQSLFILLKMPPFCNF